MCKLLTLLRSQAMLLLLLATTLPSFAQQLSLTKNNNGFYEIGSDEDFETFRQMVALGNPYANAVLTKDINVANAIGTEDVQFHYRGTFDGQGHTVNFYDKKHDYIVNSPSDEALFAFTKPGSVIRNLRLKGHIMASSEYVGSLVQDATGTIIENVISEVSVNGDSAKYIGGLVGISRGVCIIENCAFIGHLSGNNGIIETMSGIVGKNTQGLIMKSCYSAPDHSEFMIGKATVLADKLTDFETILNNYYCPDRCAESGMVTEGQKGTSVKMDDIKSGKLCYLLNQGGRKGVVWYQHGDYPYPFKGNDGKLITSSDKGETLAVSETCSHRFADHICSLCGAIESGARIDPLQDVASNYSFNNINYTLGKVPGFSGEVAVVNGFNPKEKEALSKNVKAVHIPESITYNGKEFPVKFITSSAFRNSAIEYAYIPNSVTIMEDAFSGCPQLNYLHFAEGTNVLDLSSHFTDCPLETIYIGRDLAWKNNEDEPFKGKNSILQIYWGPRVSVAGNHQSNYTRVGNYHLFRDCAGVKIVYFMGDDSTLGNELDVAGTLGMNNAVALYVNRNFTSNSNISMLGNDKNNGLVKSCQYAEYGPNVKYITSGSFSSNGGDSKPLVKVDFTNALQLEEIRENAFYGCNKMEFRIDMSPCEKLTVIGKNAFNGCSSFTSIGITASVKEIGESAFANCGALEEVRFMDADTGLTLSNNQFKGCNISNCYIGRDLSCSGEAFLPKANCSWTFGSQIKHLTKGLLSQGSYDMMYFINSDVPLICDDDLDFRLASIYLDRELKSAGEKGSISFIDSSVRTIKNVNFGSHIKRINEAMFAGASKLKFVIIPENVESIDAEAFADCENLEIVSILGSAHVGESAFMGCNKLKSLFLMDNGIKLDNMAFSGTPLSEIYTTFTSNPTEDSSPVAFDEETYDEAVLTCAGDPSMVFGFSSPWSYFDKKENAAAKTSRASDWTAEDADAMLYDRAALPHKLMRGQYDLVSMPFDMDSYYFGTDALIYKLTTDSANKTYEEKLTEQSDDSTSIYDIAMEKVDIDRVTMLSKGNTYLIKTTHDEDTFSAYNNLYNSSGISVDLTSKKIDGKAQSHMVNVGKPVTLSENDCAFVTDEGVLKFVNGEYTVQSGSAVFYDHDDKMLSVYNLKAGPEVLLSSKITIPFNEHLEGYHSFYDANFNYLAPEWVTVYAITQDPDGTICLENILDNIISKGQAVFLKSSKDVSIGNVEEYLTYTTHGSTDTDCYSRNVLKGTQELIAANKLCPEYGYVYILNCDTSYQNTGIYKLTGDELLYANMAYVDPAVFKKQPAVDKSSLLIDIDDMLTGIERTESDVDNAVKAVYDIMGRQLQEAGYEGLYIINNKKYIK